jgi:hypothetical protein
MEEGNAIGQPAHEHGSRYNGDQEPKMEVEVEKP